MVLLCARYAFTCTAKEKQAFQKPPIVPTGWRFANGAISIPSEISTKRLWLNAGALQSTSGKNSAEFRSYFNL